MAQKPMLRGEVGARLAGGCGPNLCDITARDLARTHVSHYNDDVKCTKGMHRHRKHHTHKA